MVVRKRKKNSRLRGSHTHGWGAKKKHRGAGSRGGRGRAGSGKRADSKKPSLWKEDYFGKRGFKKKGIKEKIKPVNIIYLEQNVDSLLASKTISKEGDTYNIELNKIGFNKLLSKGKVTKKYNIKTDYASTKAIDKIKKANGNVILKKEVN